MARTSKHCREICGQAALGAWLIACSVDQRELRLGAGAGASAGTTSHGASAGVDDGAGASGATTSKPGPEGGAAGEAEPAQPSSGGKTTAPMLPPLVDGCPDLDTDTVADCTVTLVKNPRFERDVESWSAVDDAMVTWDAENALSDTPSGCALLTASGTNDIDGSAFFRVSQCVAIPADQIVIAYANALVTTQSDGAPIQAELEVSFFDSEDCSGPATGQFFTPPSEAGQWATIQAGGVSSLTTHSASVSLVGVKPYRAEALGICFDNVMLKAKAKSP
jgi:hypothetical protein